MESLLLILDRLATHEARLIAWGVLALAAVLAPALVWGLARQRADLRNLAAALREGTKAGGALPRIPETRASSVRDLSAELADWAHRHSHQVQWMKAWTQKQQQEWRALHEQLLSLSAGPGGAEPEETKSALAGAVRGMEEALRGACTLSRMFRALEVSGSGTETTGFRLALERISRPLAEGAQHLEGVRLRTEQEEVWTAWPPERGAILLRMMALASAAAEEHRKMEGDLVRLLEGFLPDQAPPSVESASPALDPAASV